MQSNRSAYRLEFSPLAQQDIDDILQYTYENWGEARLLKYKEILDTGWENLILNPGIGHYRSDLPKGCRALKVGEHYAIYVFQNQTIQVFRVLHGRMNFKRQEFST
ncbi:MAG: type II toxin-antitoxin system RelE/ParE family toxin [Candidatus Omnitrophota bacterium]|jgi:toxin ParE1/3/4|nr:MAG: type II toxin-antitoxin system RelE/ParE family toxin [Candidatus Omnitrophota bacterium]